MSKRAAHLVDAVLEATVVGSFTKVGITARSRLEQWSDSTSASGRTVVITGATSGLGLAASRRLAALGANVHLVGRNERKLNGAEAVVRGVARGNVAAHLCDLSLLADTTLLAQTLQESCGPIDVVIHNAGSLLDQYSRTSEGIEATVATHLLGPFQLTERLVASSAFASNARIIFMTSGGMYTERFDLASLEMDAAAYKGAVAYARAKRAQTVLAGHWQKTYGDKGLAFHLVHPGWAATPGVSDGLPTFSKIMGPLLRTPEQGADTLVWLAGRPDGEPSPGLLWHDRHTRSMHRLGRTRLSASDELTSGPSLAVWCTDRIEKVLRDR